MLRSSPAGNYVKHNLKTPYEASPKTALSRCIWSTRPSFVKASTINKGEEGKDLRVMSRKDLIIIDISHLKGKPFTRIGDHGAGYELVNELLPRVTSSGVESRHVTRLLLAQHLESRALPEWRDS